MPSSKPEKVIDEIIDTEKRYCDALREFLAWEPRLHDPAIFQNAAALSGISEQLLSDLSSAPRTAAGFAPVFISFAPYFKALADYASRYPTALAALNRALPPESPDAQRLADLLIAPVQRGPRYELLLRELGPDAADALAAVQAANAHSNAAQLRARRLRRVFDLRRALIRPAAEIVDPAREMLEERSTPHGDVFIMTDVACVARMRMKKSTVGRKGETSVLQFPGELPLGDVWYFDHVLCPRGRIGEFVAGWEDGKGTEAARTVGSDWANDVMRSRDLYLYYAKRAALVGTALGGGAMIAIGVLFVAIIISTVYAIRNSL